MQLPRGTFRTLKRGCDLSSLLLELRDTSFSGYCRISPGLESITIVFEKGIIRLAEYERIEGDAAIERILECRQAPVDAVLHDLSPTQISLAVEFSPLCIVKSDRKKHPSTRSLTVQNKDIRVEEPESFQKKVDRNPEFLISSNTLLRENIPADGPLRTSRKILHVEVPDEDDDSLLSHELDALDTMDIDSMAEKFRANCRLMMERLDLEHLIDQNAGKDRP